MIGALPEPAAMNVFTFAQFEASKRSRGFDEILEREWKPDTTLDTHSHPFAVEALVVEGEMWLSCGGEARHLQPGDTFSLAKDVPHAERYGAQGTVFWAARKHG
jgi:mannose-6-phosphate isomerase-like protein (cupin superfamily)